MLNLPAETMTGIGDAVESGVRQGDGSEIPQEEMDLVKRTFTEYETARAFDLFARQQQERDRRYAQGIANPTWASDANIIGSFIDILVSFLYAKDPDVSARPAPRVISSQTQPAVPPLMSAPMAAPLPGAAPPLPGAPAAAPGAASPMGAPMMAPPMQVRGDVIETQDAQDFAQTAQIVVSQQWRQAKLKKKMRKALRSSLSVGPGWLKAFMYSPPPSPALEKQLGDAQDNLKRLEMLQNELVEGHDADRAQTIEDIKLTIRGLEAKKEQSVKWGLCIDFLRAEDVQVSLDVPSIFDYLEADWVSHDLYIEKKTAKARFPRMTDEDIKHAQVYYLRQTGQSNPDLQNVMLPNTILPLGSYVKSTDNPGMGSTAGLLGGQDKPVEFVKIVEMWDQRDALIKTMCDGVKRWALEPFAPPQGSRRFYPFFMLGIFEVDGARYPQSLSWRMWKLQDEYSSRRSSGRKMRERSIPATCFDSGALPPEEAEKLKNSVEQEMVGIRTTTPGIGIDKIVAAKPIAKIDPAIYDTKDILYDMNVVSGVQEAQASGEVSVDTATAADYQAEGFASRTGADRDVEEDLLNDLAQYTLEVALQAIPVEKVQKIAGRQAFWPFGMPIDDICNIVEIEIKAGTTGKPQQRADKEAWATLLPLMTNMITQIQMAESTGTPQGIQMAETQKNLLRETIKRLDDRMSLESILAPLPVPVVTPGMPGMPATSAPPGTGAPPGAPPIGNGTVNNPAAQGAPPV